MFNSTREFEATVLVRGKPVTEVVHNGKTYIEGRRKSPYELYFRNNTPQDVLVVPSVDGLSAIDGQAAGKESPGYVVGPHSEVTIPGWTTDSETAAEFIFHAQGAYRADEQTYVEEMGEDRRNQGAIGFMVFRQKPSMVWPTTRRYYKSPTPSPFRHVYGQHTSDGSYDGGVNTMNVSNSVASETIGASAHSSFTASADSFGNQPGDVVADMMDAEKSLGTGFGDAVEFETQKVEFQREANHCAVFAFFYDTLKNLRRAGVPVEQFARHYTESYDTGPDPFPSSPEVAGYANAPRGWPGRKHKKTRF